MLYWQVYFISIVILTVVYAWIICYITTSWTQRQASVGQESDEYAPEIPVTVVVIVRNEGQHIQSCLKAILSNQESLLHQIIVVDDHSEDDTIDQIEAMAHPKVRILRLSEFSHLEQYGLSYKKSALHYALANCETTWVMTTDGDCVVSASWIAAMTQIAQQSTSDMLTGPISLSGDDKVIQRWQSIEMMGTMAGTMAGIQSKTYYSANAANMLFQKDDYLHYLDQEAHNYASGDDVFFVQWMAKNKKLIEFASDPRAIVTTGVETTLEGLYQQRLRWSTKTMSYDDIGLKAFMSSIFVFHLMIFANLLFGCILMNVWLLSSGLMMLLVKAVFDFRLLHRVKDFFRYPYGLAQGFFSMIFLHSLYIVLMGLNGLFVRDYLWKGRKVS